MSDAAWTTDEEWHTDNDDYGAGEVSVQPVHGSDNKPEDGPASSAKIGVAPGEAAGAAVTDIQQGDKAKASTLQQQPVSKTGAMGEAEDGLTKSTQPTTTPPPADAKPQRQAKESRQRRRNKKAQGESTTAAAAAFGAAATTEGATPVSVPAGDADATGQQPLTANKSSKKKKPRKKQAGTNPEVNVSKATTAAQPKPKPQAKADADDKPKRKAGAKPKSKPSVGLQAKADAEAKTTTKADAKPKAKSDAKPKLEAKNEARKDKRPKQLSDGRHRPKKLSAEEQAALDAKIARIREQEKEREARRKIIEAEEAEAKQAEKEDQRRAERERKEQRERKRREQREEQEQKRRQAYEEKRRANIAAEEATQTAIAQQERQQAEQKASWADYDDNDAPAERGLRRGGRQQRSTQGGKGRTCYNCNREGHLARECPHPLKRGTEQQQPPKSRKQKEEHERWLAERRAIDEARLSRHSRARDDGSREWTRAWDAPEHKVGAASSSQKS
eukprot:m.70275 g.70275  ORF g.70275 m.70275 type:complete len:502 (+) comp14057_c1_seq1:140-1645(+)